MDVANTLAYKDAATTTAVKEFCSFSWIQNLVKTLQIAINLTTPSSNLLTQLAFILGTDVASFSLIIFLNILPIKTKGVRY